MPTSELKFGRKLNALAAAIELLSHHTPGGAVVDEKNHFIDIISEFDVLRALEAGKDLNKVTVEDVMKKDHIAISATASIKEKSTIPSECPYPSAPTALMKKLGQWKRGRVEKSHIDSTSQVDNSR